MGLTLVTAATTWPVTLDEIKAWCAITDSSRDTRLELLRTGCTREAEVYTQRGFCPQTWRLSLDDFADEIELPLGPVTAITAFSYRDAEGTSQTVDSDIYTLDIASTPQRIVLNDGESWPAVSGAVNAVSITFTVGYTPDALLADVKLAVLQLVAARLDDPQLGEMPRGVRDLLAPHRRIRI